MILIADQKRRIVLPKPVQPGDALDVAIMGQRLVLQRLQKPSAVPSISKHPLDASSIAAIDLDEPAFLPMTDESPA